jgi:hypothetical protein
LTDAAYGVMLSAASTAADAGTGAPAAIFEEEER